MKAQPINAMKQAQNASSSLLLCFKLLVFRRLNQSFNLMKSKDCIHEQSKEDKFRKYNRIRGNVMANTLQNYCTTLIKAGFKFLIQEETTNAFSLKTFQNYKNNFAVRSADKRFKNMVRQLFDANQQINELKHSNARLSSIIQQHLQSKEIENIRKKQSLEILAQDLHQKNQRIQQLESIIINYQAKYFNINVLNDAAFYSKELQKSQKVTEKLRGQLQNKTFLVDKFEKQILLLKKQNMNLNQKFFVFQSKEFDFQQTMKQNQLLKNQNERFKRFIQKKITQIRKTQKKINAQRRNNKLGSIKSTSFEQINSIPEFEAFAQELKVDFKVQKILTFIYNIQQFDPNSPTDLNRVNSLKEIFDEEQFQVLEELKNKVRFCSNQKNISQVQNNENRQQDYENVESKSISFLEQKKNLCLKIKQLEAQKQCNIQKIAQLKNNFFCIRNVVINLIKSFEIKQMKQQTLDIYNVLCNLFEYSEEEKSSICVNTKKKNFFDFS